MSDRVIFIVTFYHFFWKEKFQSSKQDPLVYRFSTFKKNINLKKWHTRTLCLSFLCILKNKQLRYEMNCITYSVAFLHFKKNKNQEKWRSVSLFLKKYTMKNYTVCHFMAMQSVVFKKMSRTKATDWSVLIFIDMTKKSTQAITFW